MWMSAPFICSFVCEHAMPCALEKIVIWIWGEACNISLQALKTCLHQSNAYHHHTNCGKVVTYHDGLPAIKSYDFWPQGLARSSNKPKTYLHYHNAHGDKTWQGWLVTYFEGLPPILIMWFCNILRQIKTNISALPQLWQQNVAVLWLT